MRETLKSPLFWCVYIAGLNLFIMFSTFQLLQRVNEIAHHAKQLADKSEEIADDNDRLRRENRELKAKLHAAINAK